MVSRSEHICDFNVVSPKKSRKDMKTVASSFRVWGIKRSIKKGEVLEVMIDVILM